MWVQILTLPPTGCVNLADSLVIYRHLVNIAKYSTSKIVLPVSVLGGFLT